MCVCSDFAEFTCEVEMRHSIAGQQDDTFISNRSVSRLSPVTDNRRVSFHLYARHPPNRIEQNKTEPILNPSYP